VVSSRVCWASLNQINNLLRRLVALKANHEELADLLVKGHAGAAAAHFSLLLLFLADQFILLG
jgi:hypothetical protein